MSDPEQELRDRVAALVDRQADEMDALLKELEALEVRRQVMDQRHADELEAVMATGRH